MVEPPLWARPPPMPIEKLPQVDPDREMSIVRYNQLMKAKTGLYKPTIKDHILKKVVLNEIEKLPAMWSTRNSNHQSSYYSMVGVETYKRTGRLMDTKTIATIFKFGKDAIRNRLKNAILFKEMNPEEVEVHMWEWSFYPFIRFYREPLQPWEAFMYRTVRETTEDRGVHEGQMEMREDMEYEEQEEPPVEPLDDNGQSVVGNKHPTEIQQFQRTDEYKPFVEQKPEKVESPPIEDFVMKQETEGVSYENNMYNYTYPGGLPPVPPHHINYSNGYHQQEHAPHSMQMQSIRTISSSPPINNQTNLSGEGPSSSSSSSSSGSSTSQPLNTHPKPANAVDEFENELNQITFQAMRVVRENPERVKLIRKVLFSAVFALDDKEFNTAGEVFRELGRRHS